MALMSNKTKLVRTILGEVQERPPIWIMRQAGRYLPEYRALRKDVSSFLEFCYTPEISTEATLQPLARFDLDAAILFSDILVVPDALGQKVWFEKGHGPRLTPLEGMSDIERLDVDGVLEHLSPVLETVRRVRAKLADEKALIGFCGSPWTVATYMLAGQGSPDQAVARKFALAQPDVFAKLMDKLVAASIDYLVAQFEAGVDVVQLFESWAANMDEVFFDAWVIAPNRAIVAGVRARISDAPIIGFPRGAAGLVAKFVRETEVNAVGLDYGMPLEFARQHIAPLACVQGNLDPLRLVIGGDQMTRRVDEILSAFAGTPHVFNLGHGIVPETPIAHVEALVAQVKGL